MVATYWLHPKLEEVYLFNFDEGDESVKESNLIQIDEAEYVRRLVDLVDSGKVEVPIGVDVVIKRAEYDPITNTINGLICVDRYNRFPVDYPIVTSEIVERSPGGIYKTQHSTFLVEVICG